MRVDEEYVTAEEIARRWRVSTWTIRDWARRGLIVGAEKAGRGWRFRADAEYERYDAARAGQAAGRPADSTCAAFEAFNAALRNV